MHSPACRQGSGKVSLTRLLRRPLDCALSVTCRKHLAQMLAGECLQTSGLWRTGCWGLRLRRATAWGGRCLFRQDAHAGHV
jgi:hypothetical protein